MKTRKLSLLSLGLSLPLIALAGPALVAGGCGGGGGGGGGGGTGGGGANLDPANLISDFEDETAATVVQAGDPPRNGYWFTYNESTTMPTSTCVQTPAPMAEYKSDPIDTAPANGMNSARAIHTTWDGCNTDAMAGLWGAGIGADLNQPPQPDGGMYMGPKVVYDVTDFKGITFWGRKGTGGADGAVNLRFKVNMSKITAIADGGKCDPSGGKMCSADWSCVFNLPNSGAWTQITVIFPQGGAAHPTCSPFAQETWGTPEPWDATDVTGIQIQSTGPRAYDFWIDDVYFIK